MADVNQQDNLAAGVAVSRGANNDLGPVSTQAPAPMDQAAFEHAVTDASQQATAAPTAPVIPGGNALTLPK